MSAIVPTTKSNSEILEMIVHSPLTNYYVQRVYDPFATHALYGIHFSDVDKYKARIKEIGGKHIRVAKANCDSLRVICFALAMTQREKIEVEMQLEKQKKEQQAFDSKLNEIEDSILLLDIGATNEYAKRNFCRYLINGYLDPLLPFESYVIMTEPTNKDERRIVDIVNKANAKYVGCVGMITNNIVKMIDLAKSMNSKITDEDKRLRRKAACLKYGLKFLAKYFEKPTA